ncbi:phosphatidate cytidylyltransferase, putative [Talaromyces stipitatus ATCC 10500]|uniref:Diphthine--ammonia ligase n=1 Tax=Talaromyces stipitatus (strain ATCC 10500 / CBS 375.48 / QM 6759 / NRRL 1006) TaxID=441959 RepID=B8ME75_TALSN|nr:phosphatidate cytidylyltransferase, putative [Talaromyces stipitatus ATCC 10500]EED16502.1 phosphatidate cytidylyltransferase, putative [Talaromyces stipitatus ATCC 10500]
MSEPLNVIALISGGKDSLYSILHCIRNGHRVVALANLRPPVPVSNDHGTGEEEEEEEDMDSFMYQTIGHNVIPLYESALGIPLYRGDIIGSAVDTSRVYGDHHPHLSSPQKEEEEDDDDETESLIPLLRHIKRDLPYANAVSAGAILSTYQRTRIENVAARLGLVPLAFLWMYPFLPSESSSIVGGGGLLNDMAAVGCDARIIKVASGGLDDGMLWENVASFKTQRRLEKSMRPFVDDAQTLKGAVLGEGGEYETLALDGPRFLWKKRIVVEESDREVCRLGSGVSRVRVVRASCVEKDDQPTTVVPEDVKRPAQFDDTFQRILNGLEERDFALAVDIAVPSLEPGSMIDVSSISLGNLYTISNITAAEAGSTADAQMRGIIEKLHTLLLNIDNADISTKPTTDDVVFTTVLLRSMQDFAPMNAIYVSLFTKPNPPARVTVACGNCLPKGVQIMVSVVIDLGERRKREGLHVQSRSYWAPANIGPYSQAITVPYQLENIQSATDSNKGGLVYIAGQIPLDPPTMEIPNGIKQGDERWFQNFSLHATLSLQHLWRIGLATKVDWWIGAIVFLARDFRRSHQKARIASRIWQEVHSRDGNRGVEEEADLDIWDIKHGLTEDPRLSSGGPSLPNFEVLVDDDGGDKDIIQPCFTVEVEQLPRNSDIEWQALGTTGIPLSAPVRIPCTTDPETKIWCTKLDDCKGSFYTIEIAEIQGTNLRKRIDVVLSEIGVTAEACLTHCTVYTPHGKAATHWKGQVVPCYNVWGSDGGGIAAAVTVHRWTGDLEHAYLQPSSEIVIDSDLNDNDIDNNATTIIDDNDAIVSETIDSKYLPNYHTRFSRSPHPYHRISSKIADRSPARSDYHQASDSGSINDSANVVQRRRQRNTNRNGNRWSRTSPRASSESGTEADDESTGLLKGLPAPPVRSSRKGLRSTAGRDDPLLWLQHETPQSWSLFVRSPLRQPKRSSSEESMRSSATYATVRGVVARRKRNEVMRRVTETALLLSVGVVVLLREDVRSYASSWHKEIRSFLSLVTVLYALYPLRLSVGRGKPRLTFAFSIPSSFDPAPLLYPVLIPLFVALSTLHHRPALILPNIVLSLSSIPAQVVPLHILHHGYISVTHWAITVIPIILSEHDISYISNMSEPLSSKGLDVEVLLLLYPLHQALNATLDFLLATSLLPAELHLLGSGLTNLLLFAKSPQAQILKALLWLGGLSVWILCRTVLRWEITLARIPTWKFRRPPSSSFSPKKLINFIDHKICEKISAIGTNSEKELDSDSDDDADSPSRPQARQRSLPRQNGFWPHRGDFKEGLRLDDLWPSSWAATKSLLHSHKRRHTISTVDDLETVRTGRAPPRTTPSGRRKRSMAPDLASFLSLTAAQARIRRWLFAGYVFTAIVATILVPVRIYISNYALHGKDPFGWALGYLFGNISSFRLWAVKWNLEYWIQLPKRHAANQFCHLGWLEHLRRDTFGEANTRLLISGHCLMVLIVGMATVLQLSKIAEVDTRRKIFHGMMVLMFLPVTYIDPTYAALALTLVLAIFLLLDLLRASQVPPVAKPLTYFLAPYTDGRDHRGPVIVSHIFLLLGCAIPLWLSLADLPRVGVEDNIDNPWSGWEVPSRDVSMVSGIICVGMGDAAASLIGRRYGRLKWFWGGGKSLEGSLAFTIAVFLGLMIARIWLAVGGWTAVSSSTSSTDMSSWLLVVVKCLLAAGGTSLTEAVLTGGNDNVIVPVVLWLLVRGLAI